MLSSLETMQTRLGYNGGSKQVDRMNTDKLKSLKKALLYSYQSCTIKLTDGRQFRALINKDKEKGDYEDKILSVPFKDVCLNGAAAGKTSEGLEEVGLKAGDTFTWLSNSEFIDESHWIIYLQYAEETAYFRGELRQCNQEVEINGNKYWAWFKGPDQEVIEWHLKDDIVWNELNYTRVMYITKNEETLSIFHRFAQFYEEDGVLVYNPDKKGHKNRWEVQIVNPDYGEGLIKIAFKEYFGETVPVNTQDTDDSDHAAAIHGKTEVYPYDIVIYTIDEASDSLFTIDNEKIAKIKEQTDTSAIVEIITSKKGKFTLTYGDDSLEVIVKSLL